MKKVYIVHGWGRNPHEKPLLWLKAELEKAGFDVFNPVMPDPEYPKINDWIRKLNETVTTDGELFFVGHSIGCQTILRYLEQADIKVNRAVLVAPWFDLKINSYESDEDREIAKPWIETPIDFQKVKNACKEFVAIFSDNDYFVDEVVNGRILKDKLGAETILEHNKKHFSEGDGINELQTAFAAILK